MVPAGHLQAMRWRSERVCQRDFPLEVFDPFCGFLGREVLGKQLGLVSLDRQLPQGRGLVLAHAPDNSGRSRASANLASFSLFKTGLWRRKADAATNHLSKLKLNTRCFQSFS